MLLSYRVRNYKKADSFLCNRCICYVSKCITKLSDGHSSAVGYVHMVPMLVCSGVRGGKAPHLLRARWMWGMASFPGKEPAVWLVRRFCVYTVWREIIHPFLSSLGLWHRVVWQVVSSVSEERTTEEGGNVSHRNVGDNLPVYTEL
jgi:hypothetical protein